MTTIDRLRAADPTLSDAVSPHSATADHLLAEILDAPQPAHRVNHPKRLVVGALLAAAAAVIAIVVPTPWNRGTPAWAVERNADGSVSLTISVQAFDDPPALQKALDVAGAKTKLLIGEAAHFDVGAAGRPMQHYLSSGFAPPAPSCASFTPAFGNQIDMFTGKTIPVTFNDSQQWGSEDANWNHATFTIDPSRVVPDGTILLSIYTHNGEVLGLGVQEAVGAVPTCTAP